MTAGASREDSGFAAVRPAMSSRWFGICIFLLGLGVFFPGIHRAEIGPVDPSMRASMARHIVETGVWYPPYFEDKVLIDHPPLYIWAEAVSMKVFGVNDLAALVPGRLFALLCVLATYFLARRLRFTQTQSFVAAAVLALTRDYILISVRGGIEPLFVLCTALSFIALIDRRAYRAGFWVMAAAFAKGPPALWPLVFGYGFLLLHPRFREGMKRWVLIRRYTLSLLLLSAAWFAWIWATGLQDYWKGYWYEQVLGSALKGRNSQTTLDPWYFVRLLRDWYWPWLPFLLAALVWVPLKEGLAVYVRKSFWPIAWALGFFAGFSLVKWKFNYYIVPAYPGFAILISGLLPDRFAFSPKFLRRLSLVLVLWLVVAEAWPIPLGGKKMMALRHFKDEVLSQDQAAGRRIPLYYWDSPEDHNLWYTMGFWVFHRPVVKIDDPEKVLKATKGPFWVITDAKYMRSCPHVWCTQVTRRKEHADMAIFEVRGRDSF